MKIINFFILYLIKLYQYTVSPFLGTRCRFYPSCSEYACECLKKYCLIKALYKIIIRIVKCNPVFPGGVDLP